jgi:hypothetical protein
MYLLDGAVFAHEACGSAEFAVVEEAGAVGAAVGGFLLFGHGGPPGACAATEASMATVRDNAWV